MRRIASLLGIAALLALLAVAGACEDGGGGDGDALTLEAYLRTITTINDDSSAEAAAIQEQLGTDVAGIASVDEAVEILSDAIDDFLAVATGVRDDLDAIKPPPEVSDLHGQLVELYAVAATSLIGVQADLQSIDTSGDINDVVAEFESFATQVADEFNTLGSQSNDICLELQGIADENSVEVDLDCSTGA